LARRDRWLRTTRISTSGACVARETLTLLQRSVTPAIFRKLAWENGRKAYKVS